MGSKGDTLDWPILLGDSSDDEVVPTPDSKRARVDSSDVDSSDDDDTTTRKAKDPVSVEKLIEFIQSGEQVNLLFSFGPGGAAGMRNVAGAFQYANVPMPTGLPTPQRGTQYHIAPGAPNGFGENSGMIDDFKGGREAVGVLLADPHVGSLLTAAYGKDFCLADDRAHFRSKGVDYDVGKAGYKKLLETGHVDFPAWAKRNITQVPIQTAQWGQDELCVIALHQCKEHGVPIGGHVVGDDKGRIYGWFVSPLTHSMYQGYCKETVERLREEDEKKPQKPYVWPALRRLLQAKLTRPERLPQYLFAAAIAFGLRPILYPSKKKINVPQSFCGAVYKHFTGYFPEPSTLVVDPADEIDRLQERHRDYFDVVQQIIPEPKFACRVSELSPEYLDRVFGIFAT